VRGGRNGAATARQQAGNDANARHQEARNALKNEELIDG
jgi:hypothetical protein